MPLLVTSVPNLAQGVSQQPDNLRYPGQCDEQINAWSTVVEGLVKRPNTRWVNQFNDSAVSDANQKNLFTHFVKRDEQNKYCVQVSLGGVGVIDLANGTNISVAVTSIAQSYLSLGGSASTAVTDPLKDLRALTVADYTFLVNKNMVVEKDTTALSGLPGDEAIIFVKLGDYDKSYSIYIDDSLVPFTSSLDSEHDYTQHGDAPATYISGRAGHSDGKYADTSYIAKDLKTCLDDVFDGTLNGIDEVTIVSGGGGYPEFYNVDTNTKYELTITQPTFSDATALAIAYPETGGGAIESVELITKGSNFNSDQATHPLVFTLKMKVWIFDRLLLSFLQQLLLEVP